MGWTHWMYTVLILACMCRNVVGKSCHFANLHALVDWKRVRSPEYPSRFPAQTQCWWKITAPPQYRIQLEFTDFSLVSPNSQNKCVWQWLNVIEGTVDKKTGGQPPMLTLCGTNRPRMVISEGNAIRLNLHSNSEAAESTYRGFSARYKYTTENPFLPDISNQLPDALASGNARPPPPPMGSKSIGDVIDPYVRPKQLPPNPNAVLTLSNRRTEEQNRARNEGRVSSSDGATNYGDSSSTERRRLQFAKRTPNQNIPTLSNNVISEDELPPRRGKSLPREVTILLAVLGTVGAVILILYLVKRFAYDKAHRKNSSGKLGHAYAHFRRFKKKKNNKEEDVEAEPKINTIAASVPSAIGTLSSKTSSHGPVKQNESLEKRLSMSGDKGNDCGVMSSKSTVKHKTASASHAEGLKTDSRLKKNPTDGAHAPERRPRQRTPASRPDGDGTSASENGSDKEHHHHPHRRRRRHRTHGHHGTSSRHLRDREREGNPSRSQTTRGARTQSQAVGRCRNYGREKTRTHRGATHGRVVSSRRSPQRNTWRNRTSS